MSLVLTLVLLSFVLFIVEYCDLQQITNVRRQLRGTKLLHEKLGYAYGH